MNDFNLEESYPEGTAAPAGLRGLGIVEHKALAVQSVTEVQHRT